MASAVHGPLGAVLREGGRLGGKLLDRMEPYPPDQAPHGAQQWADYIRASLDPTSAAGILQLATILVPGAKGGRAGSMLRARPTPAQASYLKAIFLSSRNKAQRNKALFDRSDPSVQALARAGGEGHSIGMPLGQRAALGGNLPGPGEQTIPWWRAANPLISIQKEMYPEAAGKLGPGQVYFDPGGQKLTKFPSGMDAPPAPGELGNYFPPEPQNAAAQHLLRILMGDWGQN